MRFIEELFIRLSIKQYQGIRCPNRIWIILFLWCPEPEVKLYLGNSELILIQIYLFKDISALEMGIMYIAYTRTFLVLRVVCPDLKSLISLHRLRATWPFGNWSLPHLLMVRNSNISQKRSRASGYLDAIVVGCLSRGCRRTYP